MELGTIELRNWATVWRNHSAESPPADDSICVGQSTYKTEGKNGKYKGACEKRPVRNAFYFEVGAASRSLFRGMGFRQFSAEGFRIRGMFFGAVTP